MQGADHQEMRVGGLLSKARHSTLSLAWLGATVALAVLTALALMPANSEASATSYQHLSAYSNSAVFDGDSEPQQMAVDEGTGNLFVADHAHHQIHVFAPDADTISYLTSFGSDATIEHPIGVAVDPNTSDIYVSAAGNSVANGLVRFNQDGALDHDDPNRYEHDTGFELSDTSELGSLGSTDSDFIPQPGGIALAGHPGTGAADILVLDPGNDRVHRFDSAGDPVAIFSGQGHFDGPSGDPFQEVYSIAADAEGNFTVADAPGGALRIASFQEDGTFLGEPDSLPAQAGNPGLIGAPLTAKPANGDLFAPSREPVIEAEPEILQYLDQELQATRDLPGTGGRVFGLVAFGDFDQTPVGRLYVLARESVSSGAGMLIHAFEDEGATIPPTLTIDPVAPEDVSEATADFSGTVNPNDGETHWAFEYRRTDLDPAPDWTRMDLQGPVTGTEADEVSATATELEPNLPYEVRLFGDNGDQQTETTEPGSFHTDPAAPGVETGEAWSTTADSTTLAATVNPRNSEAEYRFQYGTDGTYGQATSARSAGSGGDPLQVTAEVEGLSPDTTYHFRVVAENVDHGLTSQGDDASFETRTAQESRLPERGYELVSRRAIRGIPALVTRASEDGDAYVYMTQQQPSPGAESAENTYQRMTRSSDGTWSPDPHMPTPPVDPDAGGLGEGYAPLFSGDLSLGLFRTRGSYDPDDQNSAQDAYTRSTETGDLTWLSRDPDVPAGEPQTDEAAVSSPDYFSSDGRRAVFQAERALLPTHQSGDQLYLWDEGELHHVSILPDGSEASRTPTLGTMRNTTNAVSPDGGRVVFNVRPNSFTPLYVRGVDEGETHEIGGGDDPDLGEPAAYFGADADTTQVVYTRNATLFVYDVDTESSTEVASPVDGMNNSSRLADGVFGVSDGADRIYFSSGAELTGDASGGERYLYLAERQGSGYEISLITPIHPDDRGITLAVDQTAALTANQVDSDPSGSRLAFTSHADLVPGRQTGGFAQIYVYEREGDRLYCASCPPDGSEPEARADVGAKFPHGTWSLNLIASNKMPAWRNVSVGSGSVFFQSGSRLTEGDANDAVDVYEWRGGELQLISSGRGSSHDFFADASEDGETVFFRSRQDMVERGGVEGLVRVYAARVGGGFVPPERSAPCRGEECRGPAHEPEELRREIPAERGRPGEAAAPALARCARIVRRAIAVHHRARVLRVIARRSTGRRRALVARRARFVTRRAMVLRVHAKRCRRAVR